MASIRKRGSSWQVQVRRQGSPTLSKSFGLKADAQAWARDQERQIDRAELPASIRLLKAMTVGDLLTRYEQTVTPKKRGASVELFRLRTLRAHQLAGVRLDKLSVASVAGYRDDRLKVVQSGTVRRELAVLQHCFELARKEWGLPIASNPLKQVTWPEPSKPRERRLEGDETRRLEDALTSPSARYLRPLMALAAETGMRRGELLSIRWQDLDLELRTVRVYRTKTGHARTIPLTPMAVNILSGLERTTERVFPLSGNAVRLAWNRLRKRAGVKGLRFHDLRHEAVSRFFELGLSTPEVALISGHRDTRMLMRYTHLRPEVVAEKLARLGAIGRQES